MGEQPIPVPVGAVGFPVKRPVSQLIGKPLEIAPGLRAKPVRQGWGIAVLLGTHRGHSVHRRCQPLVIERPSPSASVHWSR